MRVRFSDGAKAVFKAEQRNASSNYRAEIAAYHLDRWLGLGRVAPVAGRALPLAWLRAHLATDSATLARLDQEVLVEGNRVWGALIAWHNKTPVVAEPPSGWLLRMSPSDLGEPREQILAWSDMILFDTLIDNTDRWSGGNVMTLGPGGPLIFLDNASAFLGHRVRQGAFLSKPLVQVCRFRRSTVEALRRVGPDAPREHRLSARMASSLATDLAAPVLTSAHLEALDARLARVLQHIEGCLERYGEEALD
ncbi:MAG: hypothetical protein RMJ98_13980 [Myxococcales bacterium]|nr:hypothetical protein [Polyangiaceae bacterium]MDW8250400.1 hypothetical protein [Myxococcales bacterium]